MKRLYVDNTQVGDAGLKHLKGLTNLEILSLYDTQVSDAGLEHLNRDFPFGSAPPISEVRGGPV